MVWPRTTAKIGGEIPLEVGRKWRSLKTIECCSSITKMACTQGSDNSRGFMLFLGLYKHVLHSIMHNLRFRSLHHKSPCWATDVISKCPFNSQTFRSKLKLVTLLFSYLFIQRSFNFIFESSLWRFKDEIRLANSFVLDFSCSSSMAKSPIQSPSEILDIFQLLLEIWDSLNYSAHHFHGPHSKSLNTSLPSHHSGVNLGYEMISSATPWYPLPLTQLL